MPSHLLFLALVGIFAAASAAMVEALNTAILSYKYSVVERDDLSFA